MGLSLRRNYQMEVFKSFLIIAIMVWITYRLFILTKRIVRGWGNENKTNKL